MTLFKVRFELDFNMNIEIVVPATPEICDSESELMAMAADNAREKLNAFNKELARCAKLESIELVAD